MNIAIIDVGTNTTRVAIFRIDSAGREELVYSMNTITRLGRGLKPGRAIDAQASAITLDTLKKYLKKIEENAVSCTKAVATAALRTASNGDEFVSLAAQAGVELEIISGETEALLVYRGVSSGLTPAPEKLAVIDIGGGSTEIVHGIKGNTPLPSSLNIGAVSATEKFFGDDPPTSWQVKELRDRCDRIIADVVDGTPGLNAGQYTVAGVAGAITTLAMIDLELTEYDAQRVHGHIMEKESVTKITEKLLKMTSDERRRIPGMEPGRADIIHAGAVILESIMNQTDAKCITVSERDIRYGLLQQVLNEQN